MGDISRVALFGKLNSLAYKAIEGATVFCKLRGNPYVDVAHWLHQVLQLQSSDLHCIVRALELDAGRVAREAGVKMLVLSHLIPPDDPEVTSQMWADAARRNFDGEIVVGADLMEI